MHYLQTVQYDIVVFLQKEYQLVVICKVDLGYCGISPKSLQEKGCDVIAAVNLRLKRIWAFVQCHCHMTALLGYSISVG